MSSGEGENEEEKGREAQRETREDEDSYEGYGGTRKTERIGNYADKKYHRISGIPRGPNDAAGKTHELLDTTQNQKNANA